MPAEVCSYLARYRYTVTTESELQAGVAVALAAAMPGEKIEREHRLSATDRPDFWLPALGIAVECKVAGSWSEVARQIARYCTHPEVLGVVLVTSRAAHCAVPDVLGTKPVEVLFTGRLSL